MHVFFVLLIETLYESVIYKPMLGRYCFLRSFVNWDVKCISWISTNNSDKFFFRGHLFIDRNIGLNINATKRLDNLEGSNIFIPNRHGHGYYSLQGRASHIEVSERKWRVGGLGTLIISLWILHSISSLSFYFIKITKPPQPLSLWSQEKKILLI